MNYILLNKWALLAALELLAWSSTFFMLYARYRMGSKVWFKIGAVLTVSTGVIPQVALGIINLIMQKKLDLFYVGYSPPYPLRFNLRPQKKMKQLDQWARRKFSKL